MQPILRFWGLTAQQGYARLALDRLVYLLYKSAASTRGNAAGHIGDAAEHFNFANPDHKRQR